MTVYCGVDFHARQQTICFSDTANGEACLGELRRGRDVMKRATTEEARQAYRAFAIENSI